MRFPESPLLIASTVLLLGFAAGIQAAEDKAADKVPIPEKAAMAEAEKTIRDLFKADYAKPKAEDRAALAEQLLKQGIEEKKDLPSKYVLLRDARDLAALAGDAEKVAMAVDEMAKAFVVDGFAEKTAALTKAEPAIKTPEGFEALARQYSGLADEAIASDKFEAALKALGKASAVAQNAKSIPLFNEMRSKGQRVQAMQREYSAATTALKTVNEKPDDPAANLTVGKYICFAKEAWDVGLPYLAKGSDAALKAIAEKELAKPKNEDEQVVLAEAWSSLGEKLPMPSKVACLLRACHWYEEAEPRLDGLTKTKVTANIEKIEAMIEQLAPGALARMAAAQIPAPIIAYERKEELPGGGFTRYYLTLKNRSAYRDALFRPLATPIPCGSMKSAVRFGGYVTFGTKTEIRPREYFKVLASSLAEFEQYLWQNWPTNGPPHPKQMHVILYDRKYNLAFKSNLVTIPDDAAAKPQK